MTTRVKICGITTLDDALAAAEAGADLLGFNFYRQSPRYITLDQARAIRDALRDRLGQRCPVLVAVVVNETADSTDRILARVGLEFAQLSGYESASVLEALEGRAFKAIRAHDKVQALDDAEHYLRYAPTDERIPALLVDAYHEDLHGGTGEQVNVEVARTIQRLTPRMMLAGGLTPQNVGGRIRVVHPWGVDVASGVEGARPGRKDPIRLQAFVKAVRIAEAGS
jgi:phosphoribosylanthranilate isomerase